MCVSSYSYMCMVWEWHKLVGIPSKKAGVEHAKSHTGITHFKKKKAKKRVCWQKENVTRLVINREFGVAFQRF